MLMASKGHFLTQIPQPMQSSSEMKATLEDAVGRRGHIPMRTTGHPRLHSCRHRLGRHLSVETMAIRVSWSDMMAVRFCS
ncbi:uncharacterized protein BJ171DRAFT_429304 [Polychytrium aggregatum]|uniref:uncharacterized protein n=1 Tax=Polychytrium aggregatum TaxID=110093 RepID=UPI0022FF0AD0|nr:uncharacterized protein BJ171DRAFT_429304 [Polychytrium aggregatum]KAI9193681.1 hypothetical protein BJ171DRAFT_429304 [Polychytrium aggregatum]